MTKNLHVPPELFRACDLAQYIVASAIEHVGTVLDTGDAGTDYPEIVAGYCAAAATIYASMKETPAIH